MGGIDRKEGAQMLVKREDGMQGSRSEAMDERGRSLVMDGSIGVSAPAWWRRTVVDGVADGGG